MSLVALVTIIGFGTGFAVALVTGSTASAIFSRLRVLQVNHWPVLALGAVLSLAVGLDTNMLAGRYALGISLALLLAGCLLNRHITGASVAAIGFAANLGVLLLNGYVPVNEGAVVAAGIIDHDGLHRVVLGAARRWSDDATMAAWLGAAIPLAPLRDVITLGDLLTAGGLANVGFRLMWPGAWNLQRLTAVSQSNVDDFDDASVVLRPAAQFTTLEHPPLPAQPQGQPHTPAPAGVPAEPSPVHAQPAWAKRVEPAPWPAPAPWPQELHSDEVDSSRRASDDEPTESHDHQLFGA
ncbi:MAG: hypothetical protein F4Z53_00120 [Acidimicrobiales bacterium]|nr:hypothetical protein [Acidimicrobiales bacterium]MYD33069.1 hypothetical protein [Acidimicrobiales bacterium]MYI08622.1 hypothetical protein [Acidimicrobiales bacterium]